MKKKALKGNVVFIVGGIIFLIGFILCSIFKFRYFFFEVIMFIGVLVETYGLFFMGKKIKKKTKTSKKKEEEVI